MTQDGDQIFQHLKPLYFHQIHQEHIWEKKKAVIVKDINVLRLKYKNPIESVLKESGYSENINVLRLKYQNPIECDLTRAWRP